jgi:hypothetical protein
MREGSFTEFDSTVSLEMIRQSAKFLNLFCAFCLYKERVLRTIVVVVVVAAAAAVVNIERVP